MIFIRRPLNAMGLMLTLAALGGCASLPISGPTGSQVLKAARTGEDGMQFRIVEVTGADTVPPAAALPALEVPRLPPPPTDMIGPGDVLDIAIYEAGVTLFAGAGARGTGASAAGASGGGITTGGAEAEHLPPQRVDDSGHIRVPYAGRLRAAGHTPEELATMIRTALKGLSQNPQVAITIQTSIANSVIVGGEVGKPGRLVLTTNRETLSDAVALAGGYRGEAKDLAARIVRDGRTLEYRLSDALTGAGRDLRVLPGDRIEVVRAPQTFAVMGASNKVAQMDFTAGAMSLAEAVASVGGANPQYGDAKAIFVFRREIAPDGGEAQVIYHLNMMKPGAYFTSQRFTMRDKDVLYIGNAAANQPSKMIQLISQLFSPVATAAVLVNAAQQ